MDFETLLHRIIECESGHKCRICNHAQGCRAGMGLCMFISGTWNKTIDRMKDDQVYFPERCYQKVYLPIEAGADHAVFDYECNLLACRYLLEKDGDRHWREWSGSCYLK